MRGLLFFAFAACREDGPSDTDPVTARGDVTVELRGTAMEVVLHDPDGAFVTSLGVLRDGESATFADVAAGSTVSRVYQNDAGYRTVYGVRGVQPGDTLVLGDEEAEETPSAAAFALRGLEAVAGATRYEFGVAGCGAYSGLTGDWDDDGAHSVAVPDLDACDASVVPYVIAKDGNSEPLAWQVLEPLAPEALDDAWIELGEWSTSGTELTAMEHVGWLSVSAVDSANGTVSQWNVAAEGGTVVVPPLPTAATQLSASFEIDDDVSGRGGWTTRRDLGVPARIALDGAVAHALAESLAVTPGDDAPDLAWDAGGTGASLVFVGVWCTTADESWVSVLTIASADTEYLPLRWPDDHADYRCADTNTVELSVFVTDVPWDDVRRHGAHLSEYMRFGPSGREDAALAYTTYGVWVVP